MILQWNSIFLIYLKLLFVTCARNSSLTFVIDDTLSMYDDIDQVREAAAEIMNIVKTEKASEIEDVVLVTFNDPEVVVRNKTSDKDTLLQALSDITVHNRENFDCPEYALSGIEKALEESRSASYLFVFTDASAKDNNKVKRVISLCEKKQSQVVFVLTGDCYDSQSDNYKVYQQIAKACNGQVFRVLRNEVQDVLETIKETIKGKKTVVTSQVVPASVLWKAIPFTVDDQSEYIIVSSSGTKIDLIIKDSSTDRGNILSVNKIMWKSSGKVVKFDAPKPGTYYAWVKADTDISILVYARTDFSFNHGFSSFVPKSLDDTSKQPIKGEKHHLSITVDDPNHTVDIQYAKILNMHEQVIDNLPLTKVKENYYITEKFVSPSNIFKIQVTGINKKTRNTIKRFSRTNVNPQDPPEPDSKGPDVLITEGLKVDVDYAGEIVLTCKVSAYPKPQIVWTSDNGAILSKDSNLVEKPYDYISYLKLSNVKRAGRYYCKASNNIASNVIAKIHVEPRNPLKAIQLPAATSTAHFGKQKKLVCNASSHFPLKITWNNPLKPSDYSMSYDNKVLTIKAVTMNAQGLYTCEFSLASDEKYKITAATTLTIDDLAPPAILNTVGQITGKFGDQAQIACKITAGVPPPIVTWQVMKKGDKAFHDILAQGEELITNTLTLEDAGQYRCIAENPLGKTAKTIELSVTKTPEAIIQEGQTKCFSYGSTNELTCKVTGYPLPSVVWTDSKGNKLIAHQKFASFYEITSSVQITNVKNPDTYYCYAGKAVSKIDIDVTSPFVVGHSPASINSKYGAKTDIVCDIRSEFPMEIKWFYQSTSIKTGRTEIHTSDMYTISSDQKTLRILFTDLNRIGTYTCAASLKSDRNQRDAFTTKVQIGDLSPPKLLDTVDKVTVNYKGAASLPCKIVGGKPPPTIGWQVKYNGDSGFQNLPGSGQEFTIPSATMENAGQYRCTARNINGKKTKDTELTVRKTPEAIIQEGPTRSFSYGSTNELTCKVTGYPLPSVVWTDSKGNKLTAQQNLASYYEISSSVRIRNVKNPDTYYCNAGKAVSKIFINVKSPFVVGHPPGSINSKYGANTDIACDIRSEFPMEIKWFYQNASIKGGRTEIHTSDMYKISSDQKTLRILFTDLNKIGTYTCAASLKSDSNQRESFTTKVQIGDLSPPELQDTVNKVTVNYKDAAALPCKIVKGTPPPTIGWQVKYNGDSSFQNLPGSGQEFTIPIATMENAGQYRCTARNMNGQKTKDTELNVTKTPEAIIQEGPTKSFTYGSTNELTCKVTGYPLPSVVWMDSKGNKLIAHEHFASYYVVTSLVRITNVKHPDTYYCYAGKAVSKIDIDVTSPFVVGHPPASINSKYGANTDIACDIQSKYPMEIKWFYQSASIKTGRTEIHTSDIYTISSDQKSLRILFTDLNKVGIYTCAASLKSDSNQRDAFTTKVQIGDLSPPKLQDTVNKVTVNYKDAAALPCKIVGGTPPPTIGWQVKYNGDSGFQNLPGSGQELTIPSATLENAGQYRCTAKNIEGEKTKDTELVVETVPETFIDNGSSITVPYGSRNELKCRVKAYPQPIIVWKNSKGHKLLAKDITHLYETVSILNLTNARSSETYFCSAENNKGTAVSSIDVKVSRAIAFPTQSSETTSVNFGTPADIKCDAKSSFPVKIKWLYQKNDRPSDSLEIHTSDKYNISSDGKMLRITSTDLDLVGTYTCEASLVSDETEKGRHTNKVEINDLKAPEIFIVGQKTIAVMKGQTVSTSCRAIGVPKPTVTWQFKAKDSDTFVPLTTQGVHITNTGYSSAGTYMCIAKNAVGTHNEPIDIIVHGKPEITNADSVYYGVKGDRVLKVPCEVTGVPEPAIIWKQGGKVVTSDEKITVNKNSLYLKDPTATDSSNFTCEATNKYGSATTNLQVDISDFVEPEKVKSRHIYIKHGASTEDIKCNLPNPGPSSIRWYVNAELSAVNSLTYSLQNANFSNDGNYTCRVNTDQGSESLNYVVDVGYLPRFITTSTSEIYWNGNKNDNLDCNVEAKPEGNTVWYFNGNEEHKKGPELFITGWGRYTCNVTNVHGSVQRTFDITSLGCIINRTVDHNLQNTPLLVNDKDATWPELLKENEFYILNKNQTINIQCGTKRNAINTFKIQPKSNKITAECFKEDQFIVDGKKYKFEDLQCKDYVMPSFEFTKKPCMKDGEVVKVGFALDSRFLSAYDVCYEQTNHKTLYTKVLMSDQNLGNRVEPGFEVDTELKNIGKIVKCQYNKRQMVNPLDVAFGPAQGATLSEYNSAPVFEPCDGSTRNSWSVVEKASRSLVSEIGSFIMWTGASQYDAAGVPRYLWKVLMFEDDVETLVYVNAQDATKGDIRCRKHDNNILVLTDDYDDDQYMYACSIDDFEKGFDVSIDKLIET